MKDCCKSGKKDKKCYRKSDKKTFKLPRKFSKKSCKNIRGFTMRSSCVPYKDCDKTGGGKSKKQFLFNPNNPKKSFDVYIDKNVVVGDNCKIQNSALIYDGVKIKNNVFVGPGVVFTNDYFPRADKKNWKIKKTIVEFGASIGANATILCGVKIGKRSMVAAGSVVINNVGENELVAGNPAKFKKEIKK